MALFESSWGKIRLHLSSISTTDGRDVVITPFTRGNVPDLDDRGEPPKEVRCALLFDHFIGDTDTPESRLEDLLLLKSKGKPQIFVHPFYGGYFAYLAAFDWTIDEHSVISATATFIASEEVNVFSVDPVGVSLDVTTDLIDQNAAEVVSQLADVEDASALPAQATAMSSALAQATNARDGLADLSQLSDRMWDEIDQKKLAFDVATWPAMRAYVMLNEAMRAATDRSMGDAGSFMNVRIDSPTTLLRLMADIYGADQAVERRDEAMSLNDIRTPGAIPAGTQLRLRQPDRT
jgi:hypothetical protein